MLRKLLYISFIYIYCIVLPGTLCAQTTRVVSVDPAPHAINASPNDSIVVRFGGRMISSGTLRDNIYIYGSQTGLYLQEDIEVDRDVDNRIAWTNHIPFKPGEEISVVIREYVNEGISFHLHPAYQWQFTVRPQSGTGSFVRRAELYLSPSSEPSSLFAADFTDNKLPDLAVLDGNTGIVSLFENKISHSGQGFDNYPITELQPSGGNNRTRVRLTANQPLVEFPHITGGDIYKTGHTSLVVTSYATDEIIIHANQGESYLFATHRFHTGRQPVMSIVADFNNDSNLDIAVLASGSNQIMIHYHANGYENPTAYTVGSNPTSMVARDFNYNGYLDLVVASSGQNRIDYLGSDQEGGYKDIVSTLLTGSPMHLLAGNFSGVDADGLPGDDSVEIAVGYSNSEEIELFTFNENSKEFSLNQSVTASHPVASLAAGDFFGDTSLDLLVTHRNNPQISLARNNGNERYQNPTAIEPDSPDSPFGTGITVADFARNGSIDIAVINSRSDKVTILYNSGGSRNPDPESEQISAFPNPFTPNDDARNDVTRFHFGENVVHNPILEVFTLEGRQVRTNRDFNGESLEWDGRDDNGQMQLPGVYIYVIKDGSKALASGVVTLAR